MDTIKFNTTIKCSGCIANVTPHLDKVVGHENWQVDLKNPNKELTITGNFNKDEIIAAVQKAGYKAEAL